MDTFLDNGNESLSGIDPTSDKLLIGDFKIDFSSKGTNANFSLKRKLEGLMELFDVNPQIFSKRVSLYKK